MFSKKCHHNQQGLGENEILQTRDRLILRERGWTTVSEITWNSTRLLKLTQNKLKLTNFDKGTIIERRIDARDAICVPSSDVSGYECKNAVDQNHNTDWLAHGSVTNGGNPWISLTMPRYVV